MGKTAIEAPRGVIFYLDPEEVQLVSDPGNALYDPRAALPPDDRLVKSIRAKGVIQPIVVRKNGEKIEVVCGRRRVTAAREVNRRRKEDGEDPITVPAILRKGDDASLYGASLIENEIRADVPPMQKAQHTARLLEMHSGNEEAVAEILQVTTQTVKNHLALLSLDPAVKKAVESGRISASAAWQLAALSREEQKAKLAELIESGGGSEERKPTTRETQRAVTGKNPAPGKRQVRKLIKALMPTEKSPRPPATVRAAMAAAAWAVGDMEAEDLIAVVPELAVHLVQ